MALLCCLASLPPGTLELCRLASLSVCFALFCVLKFGAGAGEDPFAKVKDLITELINSLLSKVSSEASRKSYCDYGWAKTNDKQTDLETQMATRSSKLETVVLKSCVLDGKFAELHAVLGPCQDCD